MPSGDRQRVWFPEMIELLRREWRESLAWDDLVVLRDHVDALLQELRSTRGIRPARMTCARCGYRGPGGESSVSVRAMILTLGRFGIADATVAKALEKRWKAHAKASHLDRDGRPMPPADPVGAAG